MARNKLGSHTFRPGQPVYISNWATVAGKKESEGPLGHGFDVRSMDTKFGERTWEQAEKKMQQLALYKLLDKARLNTKDIDLVFSGDLLNQCIGSSFTLRNTGIPHLGLYGACSTMAQSLLLATMAVGGGYADRAVAMTSSHFAGSERQYRFPLGYGGQRTPTAQWTVTGSGAALVTSEAGVVSIESATIGTVTDLGVTDANNMGAAMAPDDVKLRPSPNWRDALGYTVHIRTGRTPGLIRGFFSQHISIKCEIDRSFRCSRKCGHAPAGGSSFSSPRTSPPGGRTNQVGLVIDMLFKIPYGRIPSPFQPWRYSPSYVPVLVLQTRYICNIMYKIVSKYV